MWQIVFKPCLENVNIGLDCFIWLKGWGRGHSIPEQCHSPSSQYWDYSPTQSRMSWILPCMTCIQLIFAEHTSLTFINCAFSHNPGWQKKWLHWFSILHFSRSNNVDVITTSMYWQPWNTTAFTLSYTPSNNHIHYQDQQLICL